MGSARDLARLIGRPPSPPGIELALGPAAPVALEPVGMGVVPLADRIALASEEVKVALPAFLLLSIVRGRDRPSQVSFGLRRASATSVGTVPVPYVADFWTRSAGIMRDPHACL